ncbi:aldose 1-epimerase [Modestobacter sp. DSM 44400]|uniref:aldose 1-epimerase family protein n=1 Tax=Modestobacter sp. DSM 44400 TaxID=1550230 RepID=UPI000895B42A|nr:aldose 1-epimerase family protein [Modestobacter sp. DSM 44400]SDX90306.1 aldose 1-epimerase [Modestobacter sp. DSM 44400]
MQAPPSGKQFTLEVGDQKVIVTEVGGGLRSYRVGGTEVLDGFAADEMCTGARGQTFVPWPNRIEDGRYEFDGNEQQLPLTEPGSSNAIHGLTRWADWHLVHATGMSLRLGHHLAPRPGYPYALRSDITYRLGAHGLSVETRSTNVGDTDCPYATGAHPYLSPGTGTIDGLEVQLPADSWYPTDDRGIPIGRASVEGTDHDLRTPRRLGDLKLDTAFTDLTRGSDGGARLTTRRPDGWTTTLWVDGAYPYLELFTGDSLPQTDQRRRGLGAEPMTAAPNAFRTGDGLVRLAPGETHTATWGLRLEPTCT